MKNAEVARVAYDILLQGNLTPITLNRRTPCMLCTINANGNVFTLFLLLLEMEFFFFAPIPAKRSSNIHPYII